MLDPTSYSDGKLSSIRNPDGLWVNTEVFRESAKQFLKYGYYCSDPWGSYNWENFWLEERRRCMEGYSVGGAIITGDHYFYLNYCQILKVEDPTNPVSKKIKSFPDFWDGDYNYFWVREIAKQGVFNSLNNDKEDRKAFLSLDSLVKASKLKELFESLHLEVKIDVDYLGGGYNLIVGKSRRKGFSYKAASVASKNFCTKPDSLCIFAAYEKKFLYPKGLFTMARGNINFLNEHTAWVMPTDAVDKQDHVKASYIEYRSGVKLERGFKSEIAALTFKDNPDAARGKDAEEVWFEESGAFGTPGLLKKSLKATEDCVKAGSIKTGLITLFGTSGDMAGGTYDYSDMFFRPLAFGLLPFKNIWDDGMEHTSCGFFHPVQQNMEGFYDKQGNSDLVGAREFELNHRKNLIIGGATSNDIQQRGQETPLGPAEAFSALKVNNFPIIELQKQRNLILAQGWDKTKATPVKMTRKGDSVEMKPILDNSETPIQTYDNLPSNIKGCPLIYEFPVAGTPKDMYWIGYDPVMQDEGTSLATIVVVKGVDMNSFTKEFIVAEYVGRMGTTDDIDEIALMFSIAYNSKVMFENNVPGTKNYFRRKKQLHRLAVQPDSVIAKSVKKSGVNRVYGCHLTAQLKDAGERYIKDWLLMVLDYDEEGNPIRVLDKIYSTRCLEELIKYHRSGNFDYISSLIMVMFQRQQQQEDTVHKSGDGTNKNYDELYSMIDNMYKNNG